MMIYTNHGGSQGILRRGVDYFYSKGATSPEKAIVVSNEDWIVIFDESIEKQEKLLKLLPYIKQTKEGKYWLDLQEYQNFRERLQRNESRIMYILIGLLVVLIIVGVVLGSK